MISNRVVDILTRTQIFSREKNKRVGKCSKIWSWMRCLLSTGLFCVATLANYSCLKIRVGVKTIEEEHEFTRAEKKFGLLICVFLSMSIVNKQRERERDIVYKIQKVLRLEFKQDTLFTRIRACNCSITKYLAIGVG